MPFLHGYVFRFFVSLECHLKQSLGLLLLQNMRREDVAYRSRKENVCKSAGRWIRVLYVVLELPGCAHNYSKPPTAVLSTFVSRCSSAIISGVLPRASSEPRSTTAGLGPGNRQIIHRAGSCIQDCWNSVHIDSATRQPRSYHLL